MNTTPIFRPAVVTFANLAGLILDGRSRVVANSRLVIDMIESKQCDSAAVCLLIDLLRTAQQKGCMVEIQQMSNQLCHLLKLYQLDDLMQRR